jgi:hypothetical protein
MKKQVLTESAQFSFQTVTQLERSITMKRAKSLILTLVFLATAGSAQAQSISGDAGLETNHEKLYELADIFHARLMDQRPQLYYDLLNSDDTAQKALNRAEGIKLMYIDDFGQPRYYITNNETAAKTISTDRVWPGGGEGFRLTGGNTLPGELCMWDGGLVYLRHNEIDGRVTWMEGPGLYILSDHSTHVAGTMVASGVNPDAKGMSFRAVLDAYDYDDDESEMAEAAAEGVLVSNHSYGQLTGWQGNTRWHGTIAVNPNEDYKFGFYTEGARSWDEIAFNAPYYTIVKAAGNDRNDFAPPSGTGHQHWNGGWVWSSDSHNSDGNASGYDCIPEKGTAKNIITVGSVQDIPGGWTDPSEVILSGFSSIGPADDGRIKPDLVANGDSLWSCIVGSESPYGASGGTSMATPNISGSLNLLVNLYRNTHGGLPRAATMKALLIQTADEAGANRGPDYKFGWGLMNTLNAAEIIDNDDDFFPYIHEGVLYEGEADTLNFYYASNEPLKVTMVWTDPPGTPPAPSLDPRTPMLVNDLNIRLSMVDNDLTWAQRRPWTLDPDNPANPATKGNNTVDNVEQLSVRSPEPGCYRVVINHNGSLEGGIQSYSVVFPSAMRCAIAYDEPTHF